MCHSIMYLIVECSANAILKIQFLSTWKLDSEVDKRKTHKTHDQNLNLTTILKKNIQYNRCTCSYNPSHTITEYSSFHESSLVTIVE